MCTSGLRCRSHIISSIANMGKSGGKVKGIAKSLYPLTRMRNRLFGLRRVETGIKLDD